MVIIEPHYLPSLEFFCAVFGHDVLLLEGQAHFEKQSLRTRTKIQTASGPLTLHVPVVHPSETSLGRVPLCQVRIDQSGKWWVKHWRSIESAYRNAPYFEHYASAFKDILFSQESSVFELNKSLISHCLGIFRWKTVVQVTENFSSVSGGIDLRGRIKAKEHYAQRNFYQPSSYYQVFGGTFTPNLSVLDLVFCCGPDAGRIIANSAIQKGEPDL